MILRLLTGRLPAGAASEFSERLGEDIPVRTGDLDGLLATSFGVRGEVDHWAFVAVSVWRDHRSIEDAGGRGSAPTHAFETLAGIATFDEPEEYELIDGPVAVAWQRGAIGMVRVRVAAEQELAAETLIRRTQEGLLETGDVRTLLVGRRPLGNGAEIAAVAVWKDRDRMRTFIAERPEGPGIDPRFIELTADLRFETFDVLDPGQPLPAPAVPAVLVLDVARTFVDASSGVERLLGIPAEMLLGRRLDDFLTGEAGAAFAHSWRSFLRSGAQGAAIDFVRPNGTRVPVRYEARANLPDPGLHAWLLVPQDAPMPASTVDAIRTALETRPSAPGRRDMAAVSPTIVGVPSSDRLFHRFVVETQRAHGTPSARPLQLHLRGLYPHAVVHRRELEREPASTWYVFRDRSLGSLGLHEDWQRDPGVISGALGRDGRVVAVDAAAGGLRGEPVGRLLERDIRRMGVPGSFEDLARLLRLAFDEGRVDSTIRLLSRDSEPVDLAFHAEVDGKVLRFAALPLPDQGEASEWFAPVCLPTSDELFISRVEELCARMAPGNAAVRAAQLAARLHAFYPRAIVRSLGHVIGFGPGTHVLLVYRDGDRSPYAARPWWEEPATARATITAGRYVDANEAALALYGLTRDELLATRPGARVIEPQDTVWLSDILNRTGVLHSSARVRRPDGDILELEYRLTADPLDSTRLVAAVRAVAADDATVPAPGRSARRHETGQPASEPRSAAPSQHGELIT